MMREIVLTDAPDQEITTILSGQRCTLRFRYNVTSERWSLDLRIGETQALVGRRIVLGVDLLAPFDFGLGALFAADFEMQGNAPDRQALPERRVRLYHVDPAEIPA